MRKVVTFGAIAVITTSLIVMASLIDGDRALIWLGCSTLQDGQPRIWVGVHDPCE